MKYIVLILIISSIKIFASYGNIKEYVPNEKTNQRLAQENEYKTLKGAPNQELSSSNIAYYSAHKRSKDINHIVVGTQNDIEKFNKQGSHKANILHPRPFNNRTNSYWLNPDFQFGPGSVNDFGGNPNAEEILQPFIF